MRMLRIVSVLAALCVLGYMLSPYRPIEGLSVSHLWLMISVLLFLGSVFLLHRGGGIGVVLQLAGSGALLLTSLFDLATSWIGHYGHDYGLGDPIPILNSLKTPLVEIPMIILGFFTLLFPVGFLIYTVRASREPSNQAMQRTEPRSDA